MNHDEQLVQSVLCLFIIIFETTETLFHCKMYNASECALCTLVSVCYDFFSQYIHN
jgi:hypothetical protein